MKQFLNNEDQSISIVYCQQFRLPRTIHTEIIIYPALQKTTRNIFLLLCLAILFLFHKAKTLCQENWQVYWEYHQQQSETKYRIEVLKEC